MHPREEDLHDENAHAVFFKTCLNHNYYGPALYGNSGDGAHMSVAYVDIGRLIIWETFRPEVVCTRGL